MSKTLLVYLTESMLLLPVPLYCIYQELWGGGSGWLSGIGYVLAVPLLALYGGVVSWAGGSAIYQWMVLLCRFFSVDRIALLAGISLDGWSLCL